MTSDELLLAVDRARFGQVNADQWTRKPWACLRASPLVKAHGYGLHHDDDERVAQVPLNSDGYRRLLADPAIGKKPGMRHARRR